MFINSVSQLHDNIGMDFDNGGALSPDSLDRGVESNSFSKDSLDKDSTKEEKEETPDFQGDDCKAQDQDSAADYLDREVFPVLLPCFEKMLFAARENDVLKVQKSRFNGLDYLAELLWNSNPLHPEREGNYTTIFDIPIAKKVLAENPRPVFPRSWLWTQEEAAVVLQAAVRGFLVRVRPEVQEMRQFWKTLELEKRRASEQEGSGEIASSSSQVIP